VTLGALFGPEYVSANGRQVSARAVLHLHALLHVCLEAAIVAATPSTVPLAEQVNARIVQLQEQVTSLEIQMCDTSNALE
jgi:hypothetical protein